VVVHALDSADDDNAQLTLFESLKCMRGMHGIHDVKAIAACTAPSRMDNTIYDNARHSLSSVVVVYAVQVNATRLRHRS